MGGVLGFLVANAVLHHGMPRFIRPAFVSFSGMAANFAGVPLGFAYVATLGSLGVVTTLLQARGAQHLPVVQPPRPDRRVARATPTSSSPS